jgi:hypothetical protein
LLRPQTQQQAKKKEFNHSSLLIQHLQCTSLYPKSSENTSEQTDNNQDELEKNKAENSSNYSGEKLNTEKGYCKCSWVAMEGFAVVSISKQA